MAIGNDDGVYMHGNGSVHDVFSLVIYPHQNCLIMIKLIWDSRALVDFFKKNSLTFCGKSSLTGWSQLDDK